MNAPGVGQIAALLTRISREEILPFVGRLSPKDIHAKSTEGDPQDIVTTVDHRVEARIEEALSKLTPGVPVVGEETVHAKPETMGVLDSNEPFWLLDPIDGTKNFARGSDAFGVMLAWVQGRSARACWIFQPSRNELFTATAGGGAFAGSDRITTTTNRVAHPRGALYVDFMPPETAQALASATAGHFEPTPPSGCAAMEYPDIAHGKKDFVVYYRMLPWDHVPGALFLREAGGWVGHTDGTPYGLSSQRRLTIAAACVETATRVRCWLEDEDSDAHASRK